MRGALLGLLLAGCASTEQPKTANIPVPVSCLPANVPTLPAIKSNAELKALGDYDLVLTITAERLDLLTYSLKASAVISGCN